MASAMECPPEFGRSFGSPLIARKRHASRFRVPMASFCREAGTGDARPTEDSAALPGKSCRQAGKIVRRSEEHTSELQSLMRISYAVFCLKKKITIYHARVFIRN